MKVTDLVSRSARVCIVIGLAVAATPLSHAVIITLDGHYYDVTTVVAYDNSPILRTNPWWYENAGSFQNGMTLASSAAQQVGLSFGITYINLYGPFFSAAQSNNAVYTANHTLTVVGGFGPNQVTWAVATEVPAPPVPETASTVGLLGLAGCLLIAVRRRVLRS
jgi:hypothetical protein